MNHTKNSNNKKRIPDKFQKFTKTKKGDKYPIKTKMNRGKLVAFESIWDTTDLAFDFALGLQKSRPNWRIYYMAIPYYFEIEQKLFDFIEGFNTSVIENNIRYFDNADIKKTIDNLQEHQKNNRLSLMSSVNYIHSLLLMSRINKIHHLHTHYNVIVVANYFNSMKALSVNNQYVSKAMSYMYEQYIPKADNTFVIDIDSMSMKRHLQKIKYPYFFEEDMDKYRIALMNLMQHKRHANKVKIIPYDKDRNRMLMNIYANFYHLMKKYKSHDFDITNSQTNKQLPSSNGVGLTTA